jgi:hypothetical protein
MQGCVGESDPMAGEDILERPECRLTPVVFVHLVRQG